MYNISEQTYIIIIIKSKWKNQTNWTYHPWGESNTRMISRTEKGWETRSDCLKLWRLWCWRHSYSGRKGVYVCSVQEWTNPNPRLDLLRLQMTKPYEENTNFWGFSFGGSVETTKVLSLFDEEITTIKGKIPRFYFNYCEGNACSLFGGRIQFFRLYLAFYGFLF